MPDNQEALRREAEGAGLGRLAEQYPAQLARARAAAEQMLGGIPRHLHMYDEPAHTFRAEQEAGA